MNIAWQGNTSRYTRRPEDSANMYFVPGTETDGTRNYKYVLVNASRHREFLSQLKNGVLPEYAIVVKHGVGEPSQKVRDEMKLQFNFEAA